jgi:ABC-type transport system involved in cytochrome c biogenesis ATPase subunit
MLDEPFTALDAGGMETVTEMITLHVARGGLVVFSSHQSDRIPAARSLELDL